MHANITPDFGGWPDGSPTLYEANLNWTGFKPVTATVGYLKPWFSLYDSQSSNNFLLMERPSIIEIARNVAAGDARASVGAKAANDGISLPLASTGSYFASAYLTGAPYGANSGNNLTSEQLGFVGRLAGRPYYDQDFNLHLQSLAENVFHPSINANGTPRGKRPNADLPGSPRGSRSRRVLPDQYREPGSVERQRLWRWVRATGATFWSRANITRST